MIAILGLAAGIAAALLRGTWADRAIVASMSGLAAIPSFVGAIVLIAVFAVQLGMFPSFGSGTGFWDMVYHLVLPSLALALSFIAVVGRVTRSAMVEQFAREHVEVARSRGITPVAVVIRHVLRNATGPILTVSAACWLPACWCPPRSWSRPSAWPAWVPCWFPPWTAWTSPWCRPSC